MRALALAALLFALTATTAAASSRPTTRVAAAIHHAALFYGVSESEMRSVAQCESRFSPTAVNPHAVNGGEHSAGLFQFLPSTWRHTPYANRSIFDPWWNALAAAWLVRHDGGWREWDCKP